MKGKERESTLGAEIQTAISLNCTVTLVWFWDILYFSLPFNIWPFGSECSSSMWEYSPRNISSKIYLQVSHCLWSFPPLSTVESCSSLDMWVILMSSSLWTVEIRIIISDKKLVIEEQYTVNFQVRFGFVLI